MTIEQYRIQLAWPAARLAREAGISAQTLARMEEGKPVQLYSVAAVANALSEALGKRVTVDDLEGVNVVDR
jgi:predicted transcriptional regulator